MNTTNAFPKTIYAIQHLAFEDLGSLEDVFYQLGFRVRYFEAGVDDLTAAFAHDGLTIILGGPIGVYETEDYPFLKDEIALLKQRLAADNCPCAWRKSICRTSKRNWLGTTELKPTCQSGVISFA